MLNWPNLITIGRMLLIPIFVILLMQVGEYAAGAETRHLYDLYRYLCLGVFLLMSVGDALDGYLARRLNEQTYLGRILDPLADKLMLDTTVAFLASSYWPEPRLPFWVPVVVISRDFFILLGSTIVFFTTGTLGMKPSRVGKTTTVFQILMVLSVFLASGGWPSLEVVEVLYWVAVIFTVLSGIDYLYLVSRQMPKASSGAEGPPK